MCWPSTCIARSPSGGRGRRRALALATHRYLGDVDNRPPGFLRSSGSSSQFQEVPVGLRLTQKIGLSHLFCCEIPVYALGVRWSSPTGRRPEMRRACGHLFRDRKERAPAPHLLIGDWGSCSGLARSACASPCAPLCSAASSLSCLGKCSSSNLLHSQSAAQVCR